jgi:hypothetical protein
MKFNKIKGYLMKMRRPVYYSTLHQSAYISVYINGRFKNLGFNYELARFSFR